LGISGLALAIPRITAFQGSRRKRRRGVSGGEEKRAVDSFNYEAKNRVDARYSGGTIKSRISKY